MRKKKVYLGNWKASNRIYYKKKERKISPYVVFTDIQLTSQNEVLPEPSPFQLWLISQFTEEKGE